MADRVDLEQLTTQFRKSDDRLWDLIQLLVGSDLFQAKL
jgi:hypothetical protein